MAPHHLDRLTHGEGSPVGVVWGGLSHDLPQAAVVEQARDQAEGGQDLATGRGGVALRISAAGA